MGAPKGHPRFGGRKPGVPNKVTAEVRDLARVHGPAVLEELARLALESESDQARVAATKEILDRAYGKPAGSHSAVSNGGGGGEGGPVKMLKTRRRFAQPCAKRAARPARAEALTWRSAAPGSGAAPGG